MEKKYKYEEMMPVEFLEAVERMPVFIVPTGLLEWHGDHLPLGLDALKSHAICLKLAEKLGGGIVLPPNYYGRPGYSRYAGTLTFSDALMNLLFTELCDQLRKVGAKVITLITGHYGPCQVDFLKYFAHNYMMEHPEVTLIAKPEYEGVTINGVIPQDHAGKWETSMFWYLHSELTHMENYQLETPIRKIYDNPPNDWYKEGAIWTWNDDLTKTASKELGKRCVDAITDFLAAEILVALNKTV
jgi:creatinine amidohydrolase